LPFPLPLPFPTRVHPVPLRALGQLLATGSEPANGTSVIRSLQAVLLALGNEGHRHGHLGGQVLGRSGRGKGKGRGRDQNPGRRNAPRLAGSHRSADEASSTASRRRHWTGRALCYDGPSPALGKEVGNAAIASTLTTTLLVVVVYFWVVRLVDMNEKEPIWAMTMLFVLGAGASIVLPMIVPPDLLDLSVVRRPWSRSSRDSARWGPACMC